MGQYHVPVCIDLNEQIHPHRHGDGLKLMELGLSGAGTMAALALLLAPEGRWSGKRIAIVGDYAEPGDLARIDADARLLYCDSACISEITQAVMLKAGLWAQAPERVFDDVHLADPLPEPAGPDMVIVNLDLEEAIDPAELGDGRQLLAFAPRYGGGALTALALALSCSNHRGSGDYRGPHADPAHASQDPDAIAGRWAGDRIAIQPRTVESATLKEVGHLYREALQEAGESDYQVDDNKVTRLGWGGDA